MNARPSFGMEGNLPEMVARYKGQLEYTRKRFELSADEALAKLDAEQTSEWQLEQSRTCPPREFCSFHLDNLWAHSPEEAQARWAAVKAAAREELRIGATAATALEPPGDALWERAEFLALRDDLAAGWKPQNGIEWDLIDTMAQARRMYLFWLTSARNWQAWECRDVDAGKDPGGGPRLTNAQAADRAMEMADRWDKMFLRSLRALRDLRRYGPVVIQNQPGGQVNLAQQQIVASAAKREERAERD